MSAPTILVTGAGRGIGLALVETLALAGWQVLAGVRNPQSSPALEDLVARPKSGRIDVLSFDVRQDMAVEEALEAAKMKVSTLDVLLNNAGVFPEEGNETLEELPLKFFEEAFAVNVVGVARVTRAFLPLLERADHPRVVNLSSLAGSISTKDDGKHYCYSASKAALNMLTRTMSAELRLRGITVVSVTPGWVKTEMGGPRAPLCVAESAESLTGMLEGLSPEDSGHFLDRHGRRGVPPW